MCEAIKLISFALQIMLLLQLKLLQHYCECCYHSFRCFGYDLRDNATATATTTAPIIVTPITATTTADKHTITFRKPQQHVRAKLHLQDNNDHVENDQNIQNSTHDIDKNYSEDNLNSSRNIPCPKRGAAVAAPQGAFN